MCDKVKVSQAHCLLTIHTFLSRLCILTTIPILTPCTPSTTSQVLWQWWLSHTSSSRVVVLTLGIWSRYREVRALLLVAARPSRGPMGQAVRGEGGVCHDQDDDDDHPSPYYYCSASRPPLTATHRDAAFTGATPSEPTASERDK